MAGDRLAPADRPDVLAGLGLDVHGRFAHAEQPGEVGPDGLLVRSELGLLGMNDDVAIDGPPSGLLDLLDDLRQQPRAVQPAPLRIGIRVVFPDIAQPGRPQERIGHRMANHVRVGVPQQSARVLDPEPTQDQRPPLAQPMRVVPDPNPHVDRLRLSIEDQIPTAVPYKRPARIVAFSPVVAIPTRELCRFVPMMKASMSF